MLAAGFSKVQVGWLITATLLGSAAVVMMTAVWARVFSPIRVLQYCALAMVGTGILFSQSRSFLVLFVVAVLGPLNPSNGDVSAFLPAEQSLLANNVVDRDRTSAFARFSFAGFAGAAIGSLVVGVPERFVTWFHWPRERALSSVFWVYAGVGLAVLVLYRTLRADLPNVRPAGKLSQESRRHIARLTALFCLDSAGGGFVVNALLAVWLSERFGFELARIGMVFFLTGVLSACSSFVAPRLARRFGLVRTMVMTHLPANAFLIGAAIMPNAQLAVGCLLCRSLLSQLDVPTRQSFVMAIVRPEERSAAAAFTNIPRSLASASTPVLAGWMLSTSHSGLPLIIGGGCKIVYDLLLLLFFDGVTVPEES